MRKLTYTNPNGSSIIISDIMYGTTSMTGLGVPDMTLQEKKAPYQDGSTHIDQLFEPRDVEVEGTINTGIIIDIYSHRRILAAAFNPKLGPGELLYENDNGSWLLTTVTPEGPVYANRNANEGAQKWSINFHAYDPYWKNPNETQYTLSGTGTLDVVNNGDVDCPVGIVIYGPITNPKVVNNTTGEYIQIIKTIADGEYVIIYTKYGEKAISISTGDTPLIEFDDYEILVDGVELSETTMSNGMAYLNLNSTFFTIGTGTSELELIDAGSDTTMSMVVTFRERFVGV